MEELAEFLEVKLSKDFLSAKLFVKNDETFAESNLTKDKIINFLNQNNIKFGIKEDIVTDLIKKSANLTFPVTIAEGIPVENGLDGYINYEYEIDTDVDRSEGYDFREVMTIPIVKKEEKLATIMRPTEGINGQDVLGRSTLARPGKPARMRAGKNVDFNEEDQSFYAATEGQVSFGERAINVFTVYEVHSDISMKTGNIDFVGSVIIRGDVPSGFKIKATGNVTIYGMVEAATIIAGESITISEGISGMKKGVLNATGDIKIGYINQAKVTAGKSIYVENSILHSNCAAVESVNCQKGSIIGGEIYSGHLISVNDLGNKINTHTDISFGVNELITEEHERLLKEKTALEENIQQFNLLIKTMGAPEKLDAKTRITLLKVRNSHDQVSKKLSAVNTRLTSLISIINKKEALKLEVKGTMYPNVSVAFGRYKRQIDKPFNYCVVTIERNEIKITTL